MSRTVGFDDVSPYRRVANTTHKDHFIYNEYDGSSQTLLTSGDTSASDESILKSAAFDGVSSYHGTQDVSYDTTFPFDDDLKSSQAFISSPTAPVDPWSLYNPRISSGPYASSPFPVNTFIESSPIPYPPQGFETSYASYESGFQFGSPDAETPSSCSPPPSLQPQAWPATSGTTFSSAISTNENGAHNITPCEQCGERFTGTYKRGNLARHMKHVHGGAEGSSYPCTATGCFKNFKRSDAWLKHARKQHPHLRLPPVQKRHCIEQYSREPYTTGRVSMINTPSGMPSHDKYHESLAERAHPTHSHLGPNLGALKSSEPNLDYNVGQWLQVEQSSVENDDTKLQHSVDSLATLGNFPHAARCVFTVLQKSLGPSDYSRICESFFTRWHNLVQYLCKHESAAYPVYAKVLEDIHTVVRVIDSSFFTSEDECITGSDGFTTQASRCPQSGSRSKPNSGLGSGARSTSSTNRISKSNGSKRPQASGSGQNLLVMSSDSMIQIDDTKVACPVFKHHIMSGETPPCNGCPVRSMAHVRSHLNPDRAGTHGDYPAFIKQCSQCKDDFIDATAYNDHKATNLCEPQNQLRGRIEVPWARLYLKLYPGADRVPLPWPGQVGWLSDEIVILARLPRGAPIPSSHFLDRPRSVLTSPPDQLPSSVNDTPQRREYMDAVQLMMQDIFTPRGLHSLQSPALTQAAHPSNTGETLQLPANQTPYDVSRHWHNVFENLPGEPERLANALNNATYLSPEELRNMANVVTAMYFDRMDIERIGDASGGAFAQYDLRQAHPPIPPPTMYLGRQDPTEDLTYATPARQQPFPPSGYGQYLTPSSSTQPSSGFNGTGSSRQHDSTLTNPSSTLPSPYSPTYYRRTSLPPGDFEDTMPLRRARPSHISLPETHGQATLPYMPPSIPNTPGEDGVDVFPVPRRLFDGES